MNTFTNKVAVTLMEHMELTLSLEEKARRKALAKTRRLRKTIRRPRRAARRADRPPSYV